MIFIKAYKFNPGFFTFSDSNAFNKINEVSQNLYDMYFERISQVDDYMINRFHCFCFHQIPRLIDVLFDKCNLSEMTVVEFGCGKGIETLMFSHIVKECIGIDIDAAEINFAKEMQKSFSIKNVNFINANIYDVIRNPERYGLEINYKKIILLVHSVAEHLIPEERDELFNFMIELHKLGALILFLETQNRLINFDGHSSYMHMQDYLPDYLAMRYLKMSPRKEALEIASKINDESEYKKKEELLYRFGRGYSYHDFELTFGETCNLPVISDGWHPLLINFQYPTKLDFYWAEYLAENKPNVHKAFYRTWIDLVITPLSTLPSNNQEYHYPQLLLPCNNKDEFQIERSNVWWNLDSYILNSKRSRVLWHMNLRNEERKKERKKERKRYILLLNVKDAKSAFEIKINGNENETIYSSDLLEYRPKWWNSIFAIPMRYQSKNVDTIEIVNRGNHSVDVRGIISV